MEFVLLVLGGQQVIFTISIEILRLLGNKEDYDMFTWTIMLMFILNCGVRSMYFKDDIFFLILTLNYWLFIVAEFLRVAIAIIRKIKRR